MLLITCPHCGPRDEAQLRYGGEAHVQLPADPDGLTDAAWARFLFYRANPEGWFTERWFCAGGCRRWFHVTRDTLTNEIAATWPIGAA